MNVSGIEGRGNQSKKEPISFYPKLRKYPPFDGEMELIISYM